MEKNGDPMLRAYVVWVPKVAATQRDVPNATRFVRDERAKHYWDGEGALLHGYEPVLSIAEDAWDIYMVYGPDARWESDAPPEPDYWMHQLDLKSAPIFDAAAFGERVKSLAGR
jgi:hypothetical protein